MNEAMQRMLIDMAMKQLPPGFGDKVAVWLQENMDTVDAVRLQLNEIENETRENRIMLAEILELLKNDNDSNTGKPARKRVAIGNDGGPIAD